MVPTSPKLGWLIKQNKRYAPLLDTGLKLAPVPLAVGALFAVPMLFLFNGYLGQLNQPAIPVSEAGNWVFLLLFSIVVTLTFAMIALLPAAWTALVRWNAPTLSEQKVRAACAATALVTVGVVLATMWLGEEWTPWGLALAIGGGGLAGGLVTTKVESPYSRFAAAWGGFAASAVVVVIWLVSLWLLLLSTVAASVTDKPIVTAIGLLILLLVMLGASIVKPVAGMLVGVLITGFWVVKEASPDGGTMIANALYTANLGGGRPAHTEQPEEAGEICNLGVDGRPVFYVEAEGCNRAAALRRLRELKGKSSLERRRQIRLWDPAAVKPPVE